MNINFTELNIFKVANLTKLDPKIVHLTIKGYLLFEFAIVETGSSNGNLRQDFS